jgi:hypothetical protein
MIGAYIADAAAHSGRFRTVVRDADASSTLALGGRVVAIEELDTSPRRWLGHLIVVLEARDSASRIVWSRRYEEIEAMPSRNPAGLARAITVAMQRVVARALPDVADVADRCITATTR